MTRAVFPIASIALCLLPLACTPTAAPPSSPPSRPAATAPAPRTEAAPHTEAAPKTVPESTKTEPAAGVPGRATPTVQAKRKVLIDRWKEQGHIVSVSSTDETMRVRAKFLAFTDAEQAEVASVVHAYIFLLPDPVDASTVNPRWSLAIENEAGERVETYTVAFGIERLPRRPR